MSAADKAQQRLVYEAGVPRCDLSELGFSFQNGVYTLKEDLGHGDLQAVFSYADRELSVEVLDSSTGEAYLPLFFSSGTFARELKSSIEKRASELIAHAFYSLKKKLLEYAHAAHGSIPDSPWKKDPDSQTLKTAAGKWYALFTRIPLNRIISQASDSPVHILNLKAKSERLETLIDGMLFFPAWHMNKKHWLTTLLCAETDYELICTLMDESFFLVSGTKIPQNG